MDDVEFSFKIEAYSPETFPMERLGAYIADLGAMLGDSNLVHFTRLEGGSTGILHLVRKEVVARVEGTLADLAVGRAEPQRQRAYVAINRRLKEDNTSGEYKRRDGGAVILAFPGIKAPEPEAFGPIERSTVLDGTLISLGGRDSTVPVRVQTDQGLIVCSTTRDIARRLAPHLFGEELRLTGAGRWSRSEVGGWSLDLLKIESFTPLGRETLIEAVDALRSINAAWDDIEDVVGD